VEVKKKEKGGIVAECKATKQKQSPLNFVRDFAFGIARLQ
jgi:hypothetical protein